LGDHFRGRRVAYLPTKFPQLKAAKRIIGVHVPSEQSWTIVSRPGKRSIVTKKAMKVALIRGHNYLDGHISIVLQVPCKIRLSMCHFVDQYVGNH
jgi:hypothetical protein